MNTPTGYSPVLDNELKNEFSPFVSWTNVHYKNYNIFKYLADIWNNLPQDIRLIVWNGLHHVVRQSIPTW